MSQEKISSDPEYDAVPTREDDNTNTTKTPAQVGLNQVRLFKDGFPETSPAQGSMANGVMRRIG